MLLGLEKITLVNFPGKVACAVFMPGCNMRCGFCHNAELVLADTFTKTGGTDRVNKYYTLEEVFDFLEKRRNLLSGVVISGGEPFASPHLLYALIERVKGLGLSLKLDTNGLFPERLKEVLKDSHFAPQMVAIDVKTSPDRYIELMPSSICDADLVTGKIVESLDFLKKEQVINANFVVDYRTVLIPNLVDEKEIREMIKFLPSNATWSFAKFIQGGCLNPEWNFIKPYSEEYIAYLVGIAQSFVKGAKLR